MFKVLDYRNQYLKKLFFLIFSFFFLYNNISSHDYQTENEYGVTEGDEEEESYEFVFAIGKKTYYFFVTSTVIFFVLFFLLCAFCVFLFIERKNVKFSFKALVDRKHLNTDLKNLIQLLSFSTVSSEEADSIENLKKELETLKSIQDSGKIVTSEKQSVINFFINLLGDAQDSKKIHFLSEFVKQYEVFRKQPVQAALSQNDKKPAQENDILLNMFLATLETYRVLASKQQDNKVQEEKKNINYESILIYLLHNLDGTKLSQINSDLNNLHAGEKRPNVGLEEHLKKIIESRKQQNSGVL